MERRVPRARANSSWRRRARRSSLIESSAGSRKSKRRGPSEAGSATASAAGADTGAGAGADSGDAGGLEFSSGMTGDELLDGEFGDVDFLHAAAEGGVKLREQLGPNQVARLGFFQIRDGLAPENAGGDVTQLIRVLLDLV